MFLEKKDNPAVVGVVTEICMKYTGADVPGALVIYRNLHYAPVSLCAMKYGIVMYCLYMHELLE